MSMRYCVRCGRRLKKSEKLKMCERCRKETVRQFLIRTLDDIEQAARRPELLRSRRRLKSK
jgi:NMD protein affecting ribosome stability and mRNA decay